MSTRKIPPRMAPAWDPAEKKELMQRVIPPAAMVFPRMATNPFRSKYVLAEKKKKDPARNSKKAKEIP
jgi:hypothetical protein